MYMDDSKGTEQGIWDTAVLSPTDRNLQKKESGFVICMKTLNILDFFRGRFHPRDGPATQKERVKIWRLIRLIC